jgi:hypothetical protein
MPRRFDEPQEVQALLLRMMPDTERHEPRAMFKIAVLIGCTRATIYNWINDRKLPAHRAKDIVDISRANAELGLLTDPLSLDELHKFVYAV